MRVKRKYINISLGIIVVALIVAIVSSVMKPVNFAMRLRSTRKR